jgi:hypothetical protein
MILSTSRVGQLGTVTTTRSLVDDPVLGEAVRAVFVEREQVWAEETGGDEGNEVGDALRHVGCLLTVLEEIVVNGPELIRLLSCDAHVVANHEPRQLVPSIRTSRIATWSRKVRRLADCRGALAAGRFAGVGAYLSNPCGLRVTVRSCWLAFLVAAVLELQKLGELFQANSRAPLLNLPVVTKTPRRLRPLDLSPPRRSSA